MAGCFFEKAATKPGIISASTSRKKEIGKKKIKAITKRKKESFFLQEIIHFLITIKHFFITMKQMHM